jgi:hypothetical protein
MPRVEDWRTRSPGHARHGATGEGRAGGAARAAVGGHGPHRAACDAARVATGVLRGADERWLKEVFAQVVSAKKEGLAALEKARGETAALRHLANAAKVLEDNPNLMQLRVVQAIGQAPGSTLVLGMPSQAVPVPVRTAKSRPPQSESVTAPRSGEGEA